MTEAKRVQARGLVARMTLEEKAALVTGSSTWTTAPVERLGVPSVFLADGPHGVRRVLEGQTHAQDSEPATCFPTAVSLASSWDVALAREVGQAVAEEARALGVHVVLGPGVNIKRVPVCGRNFEYLSEDPHLAGEMAVAWIDGAQGRGVGTSLKHFALNNQEFRRNSIDVEVDERALREIYLPAFEAAVRRARPWTVMCAYNKVGGTLCAENAALLTGLLRDEWGYEGVVVSDWGAVRDRVASLAAGVDLDMPGPKPRRVRDVIDAVRGGRLDEATLDDAAVRLLRLAERAGAAPAATGAVDPATRQAHHALARRAAADGMVLLVNDGTLPLTGEGRIAVIGRSAKEPHTQGGGSSHIHPTRVDVPLDALVAAADGARVSYSEGWAQDLASRPDLVAGAVSAARDADVALVFVALPGSIESEGYDREGLGLPAAQVELIRAVAAAQPRTVVVLNSGGAVDMTPWIDDVAAVLQAWTMGQAGGGAIADVLLGAREPGGRLAETFPRGLMDTPAFLSYPGENGVAPYREGLFVGYRWYEARGGEGVLFPFGHGLGYTTFAFEGIELSHDAFAEDDVVTVSFTVRNTGGRAGSTVAQLYVRDLASRLRRPTKELKGFAKVALAPAEARRVTLALDRRAFAYWDPAFHDWVAEPGAFEVLVGASSADIRLRATLELTASAELPCILDRDSSLREWLADPRGKAALGPLLDDMTARIRAAMGADEEGKVIGMDMMGFVMDMPLVNLFAFDEAETGPGPLEQVDALLVIARGGRPAAGAAAGAPA